MRRSAVRVRASAPRTIRCPASAGHLIVRGADARTRETRGQVACLMHRGRVICRIRLHGKPRLRRHVLRHVWPLVLVLWLLDKARNSYYQNERRRGYAGRCNERGGHALRMASEHEGAIPGRVFKRGRRLSECMRFLVMRDIEEAPTPAVKLAGMLASARERRGCGVGRADCRGH